MIYYKTNKSYWHDISARPMENPIILNFVVEIPENTKEKMEVSKEIVNNPIVLDRMYKKQIPFIYGCIPRTYEDPSILDPILNVCGDDDPLDACNITNLIYNTILTDTKHTVHKVGDVSRVIVLGVLAIIDLHKADWKLIVIDIETYYQCIYVLNLSKEDIFNDYVKNVIKDWYDSDPKSVVKDFYDDYNTIVQVIDHAINSYNKIFHNIL
jgi:inorganic pyrophosphatase